MEPEFDLIIGNPITISDKPVMTIGQILFDQLEHRDENCTVILSHIENKYAEISLFRLRKLVFHLIAEFKDKGIVKGQTVILLTFNGCNEMYTAVYFLALASMGCRVFMPMYSETVEFSAWIDLTHTAHIIYPQGEVFSLEGHEREKSAVKEIKDISFDRNIKIWDNISDFSLLELLKQSDNEIDYSQPVVAGDLITQNPDDEVLIVTTSGSSGQSRLVVYTHKSHFYNCLAWEEAGFYSPDKLGGTGFTPLFTHTMGIRAFINALWTGAPVCLIITEWFIEKPEIVRFLLLNMKPAHVTGGPAVYNAFIELFRLYPELKAELKNHLETLVSSGALFNPNTAKEIMNATGLHLHNAFGTTETQQVSSTLLSPSSVFKEGMIPLGKPLPGVSIGLKKSDTGANHYRFFVKSIFGHKYCVNNHEEHNEYFDTGDIVFCDENENLFYVGRTNLDYFKDSFGVKIPLKSIRSYYEELIIRILHAEFYPIINFPGISALLFVQEPSIPVGLVLDRKILKKYAGIVEGINNKLICTLETFEFQHRHVCRIAVINHPPPLTGKGSISVKEITRKYHDLIERLTDARKDASGIEITERLYQITDKYTRFISPWIGSMMTALKINLTFHRGSRDTLYSYVHGKEIEVLDLVGGYGTNLLGHNHPQVCKEVIKFINSGNLAICNQLSVQKTSGLLAEKMNLLVGKMTGRSYRVIFGNSGAEAVEIALHHAHLEWRKRIEKFRDQQIQVFGGETELNIREIWNRNMKLIDKAVVRVVGLSQAFHGHSASARSVLGNGKYRNRFRQLTQIEPLFIDDRDSAWKEKLDGFLGGSQIFVTKVIRENGHLEKETHKISTIIAAIAEPVIGEGGVRVVNRELLIQLASQDFPLISDEIQCGLGRSGSIPEFESADYYLFGKALGGGVEKISAVMIDSTRWCHDFSEHYFSTFGNGELAAHAALATLYIIEAEKLCERSVETGKYLKNQLLNIHSLYPSVIQDVQGKGLMQAVYFNPGCAGRSILLRILFQTEKAGYLFAGWFLNRHRIRILPTLSAPNALRIEPSAYFNKAETDRFCFALEELCQILKDGRTYELFSYLMDNDPFQEQQIPDSQPFHYNHIVEPPDDDAVKVAFIAHFVFPLKELRMLEPDLEHASDTGLRLFFKRMQTLMEGRHVQIMATHLFNRKVHFSFYALALDSAELEYLHKSGKRRWVVSKIQETVDFASSQGARIISLGGYTSILTNNGLSLTEPHGTRVITGNTLTAASGLVHLGKVLRQKAEFNKANEIALIGATGNIGRIIAKVLSEQDDICKSLLLVSRSQSQETDLMKEVIKNKSQKVQVKSTTNLSEIKNSDVIVVCTNTNDPIVFSHHISHFKPVLISDLSVPSAVSEDVKRLPNVTVIPFAAYVGLPEDCDVVISSYSPPGTVFCCAGEAILLALESCDHPLKGKILPESVEAITKLGTKHGFFNTVDSIVSYKTSY